MATSKTKKTTHTRIHDWRCCEDCHRNYLNYYKNYRAARLTSPRTPPPTTFADCAKALKARKLG